MLQLTVLRYYAHVEQTDRNERVCKFYLYCTRIFESIYDKKYKYIAALRVFVQPLQASQYMVPSSFNPWIFKEKFDTRCIFIIENVLKYKKNRGLCSQFHMGNYYSLVTHRQKQQIRPDSSLGAI